MYAFSYHRAQSIEDAAAQAAAQDEAMFLSGGMTLLPTMKQRLAAPSVLIDLTRIGQLQGIRTVAANRLRIGGCTTHADVAADDRVAQFCPALATLAGLIGDPAVRHRGTIGGSVANNDPAADYPSAVLALTANIETSKRVIAADDYFAGLFETALAPGEFVTAVEFTRPVRAAYAKFPNPASRYAMAGTFVAAHADGSVRVAVTGAGANGVFRWAEAEAALAANWSADALTGLEVDPGDMISDIHGSADYRAALVKVMAQRAVARAS